MVKATMTLHCSFCEKSQHEVAKLVAGNHNVCICDECIPLCMDILTKDGMTRYVERVDDVERLALTEVNAEVSQIMGDKSRRLGLLLERQKKLSATVA